MSDSSIRMYDQVSTTSGGITVNTPYEDADKSLSVDNFLQLMIAQMKNIDFMGEGGGVDSAQFVTQLAQISSMQEMQNLAYYSKSNYVMGMVGKEVTVAQLGIGGKVNKDSGIVEKITLANNEFMLFVNGKGYKLSEVMSVNNPESVVDSGLNNLSKSEIFVMSTNRNSASLRWDKPTDDVEVLGKLTYTVYYSEKPDMGTVEDIKKNGTVAGDENQKNLYMTQIDGLDADTTYYVNVVVTATDGKQYVYKKQSFKTEA